MKLASPEEIDDCSKTARVSIKVELIVLEKTEFTKFSNQKRSDLTSRLNLSHNSKSSSVVLHLGGKSENTLRLIFY